MRIGPVPLRSPFVVSPMAGMTDTAFRRLVKRQGGCGLVVSEMVSSEGLVRGIDRTLEYAEYTEEERPVSIQIFGGDPDRMAEAARVVEGMGADIVDVNMGCPVPKIARHNAGCSLMREPAHAATIIGAMVKAVRIPVTVKMRKGWDESELSAPEVARRVEDAGAAAIAIHGRTAKQSYSGQADWDFVAGVAQSVRIPVFGSGDCIEPEQVVERLRAGVSGVFVGRGVLRNPWILAQAQDLLEGRAARAVSAEARGRFLLDYMQLLLDERAAEADGFRHVAPGQAPATAVPARGRERWVINKLRALCAWYTKGMEGGSQMRTAVNAAESVQQLRELIEASFLTGARPAHLPDLVTR
ncbi:MAG: tRNA dihydrouridine synthase DusB [Vicinamibacterales bacterium]